MVKWKFLGPTRSAACKYFASTKCEKASSCCCCCSCYCCCCCCLSTVCLRNTFCCCPQDGAKGQHVQRRLPLLSCFFLFLHLASSFALWNLLSLLAWPMHLPRCTHGQCTWPHVAARIIKSICCQHRHCDLLCFYTRYTRESRVFELIENVHKRKKEAWQTPTKYY